LEEPKIYTREWDKETGKTQCRPCSCTNTHTHSAVNTRAHTANMIMHVCAMF